MNRLVLPAATADEIRDLLFAAAPDESGCFCLLRQGQADHSVRLLVGEPLLPPADEAWDSQRPDQLIPSARWLSACISAAIREQCGLLWVHSHPDPRFPTDFSAVDRRTLAVWAQTMPAMIDGPFAAAVVSPNGWVAEMTIDGAMVPIEHVASVGRNLRSLDPPSIRTSRVDPMDARQRDALGEAHDRLRSLTVGLVGGGGLGSPGAEELVRMGVKEVVIIEHDRLDTPSNVRRVFGSRRIHLDEEPPPAKVDVVGDHLDAIGLDAEVTRVDADVRVESAFRKLLDCDVVVCATDTHGSRAVINDLASTYLLPVIDVGVRAGARRNGELNALLAEIRVLTPVTPCLWCRKILDPFVIRAENLPPEERAQLAVEGYLPGGFGEPEPSVVALTVLGAGLAACALLALLSEEGDVAPSAYWIDGFFGDSRELDPKSPVDGCLCRSRLGRGDQAPPSLLPDPAVASGSGFLRGDRNST
ncbi:MAG: ThiF family adenylyltransferase [Solirubrobacteraceae bacterium]|nr:ThiF family adenylyltransferase [Solirubrobacteraceae bacterium]